MILKTEVQLRQELATCWQLIEQDKAGIESLRQQLAEMEDKYLVERGMRRLNSGEAESLRQQLAESSAGWHNANMLALENGVEADDLRQQLASRDAEIAELKQTCIDHVEIQNALRDQVTLMRDALLDCDAAFDQGRGKPASLDEALDATEPTSTPTDI